MARETLVKMSLGELECRLEQESDDGPLWLIKLGPGGRSASRSEGSEVPLATFAQGRWRLAGRTPIGTARLECELRAGGEEPPRLIESTRGWIAVMPEGPTLDVTIRFRATDGRDVATHEEALHWQEPPWDAHPWKWRIRSWLRRPKKGFTTYGPSVSRRIPWAKR